MAIAILPDNRIVSSSTDLFEGIRIWTSNTDFYVDTNQVMVNRIVVIDNDRMIISSRDESAIWDIKSGKYKIRLTAQRIITFLITKDKIIGGLKNGDIIIWDLKTEEYLYTLKGHIGCIRYLCFISDTATLASGSQDKTIKIWDLQTKEMKKEIKLNYEGGNFMTCIVKMLDGNIIVGSRDSKTHIYDPKSGELITSLHTNYPTVAIILEGHKLIIVSKIHEIGIWE